MENYGGIKGLTATEDRHRGGFRVDYYSGDEAYLTLPPEVTYIGKKAFYDNKSLKRISGQNVTIVDEDAFGSCPFLKEFDFPALLMMWDRAFESCVSLKAPKEWPKRLTYIGDRAFKGCQALESFEPATGLLTIGGEAFADCFALKAIALPDTVGAVFKDAFLVSLNQTLLICDHSVASKLDAECPSWRGPLPVADSKAAWKASVCEVSSELAVIADAYCKMFMAERGKTLELRQASVYYACKASSAAIQAGFPNELVVRFDFVGAGDEKLPYEDADGADPLRRELISFGADKGRLTRAVASRNSRGGAVLTAKVALKRI